MEQSQLIELIRILQPEEEDKVLRFATLTMFNQGRMKAHVGPLLVICLKHYRHQPEQILEKKVVFAALFPGQKFVDGKLEKVMVEAHKVVRTFLLAQHYFREGNEFHQVFDFSEIVRIRGLKARYQHLLSRLKKIHEESRWKNAPYFHRQFLLEYAIHDHESLHNQVKGDLNVPNVLQALELHYYVNRLALLNRFLLQQKFANIEIPATMKPLLEESIVPAKYLEDSPFILVNHTIFTLLRKNHPEPSDARFLFDLLIDHEKNLDSEALTEFYTYLRNICVLVLTLNSAHEEINFTLHELYKDNLERGYLHYEGKLHPSRYLAISENAARVKRYEWALEFIEKHKYEIIGENESQDIYRLNMANYLFGVGQFSECLDYIPATSPFVDYLLHGKRLELKAFYELQSDLLSYKLDAFKMFLSRTSRNLLSDTQRQIHVDFTNHLAQIISATPGDQQRADRVIKRIEENKQVAEWRWLLAKAKALKEK